ncbi:MAG: hypothetical protein GY882_03975 [Actinomycetia bacterium]|nr:hypothetical protein [Actinomycetes bacterium]MCP4843688.1 hypothetical protein [Actinomycetes bacterium]
MAMHGHPSGSMGPVDTEAFAREIEAYDAIMAICASAVGDGLEGGNEGGIEVALRRNEVPAVVGVDVDAVHARAFFHLVWVVREVAPGTRLSPEVTLSVMASALAAAVETGGQAVEGVEGLEVLAWPEVMDVPALADRLGVDLRSLLVVALWAGS